ncbi:MAG: ANTAR domain-containing protein [Lachnospiraceae bacterium]|nr:ANTAR domain-containing protein [Lachnospiraceae bacterium]
MGSIIIATPKYDNANQLAEIIRRSDITENVSICTIGSDVLRKVEDMDVSIVICVRKLKDMGYEELSGLLPSHIKMLLLTKDPDLVPFSEEIVKLLLPFKVVDLIGTLRTLLSYEYYPRKKKKPMRSPEEQRLIDRAKTILMERNDMSEPEAFRFIQKSSMDTGRTLVESAQMILLLNDE